MSDSVLQQSLKTIENYCVDNKDTVVFLHGGEPFLYDNNKIRAIIDRLNNQHIAVSAGTNLVYNIDDKLDIFKRLNCNDEHYQFETSWDYRIRFANTRQQQLWESNIKTLIANDINPIVIVSMTKTLIENCDPKSLFDYLKSLNVRSVHFERVANVGSCAINNELPTNQSIDNWVYNAYTTLDRSMWCRLFDEYVNALKHVYKGCIGCCNQTTKNITINVDGSIGQCPNIAHIRRPITSTVIDFRKLDNCRACEYFDICRGNCLIAQWDNTQCPGYKKLYHAIIEHNN